MVDIPPPPFLEIPYRFAEGCARISATEIRIEDQIYSHEQDGQYLHWHVGKLHRLIAAGQLEGEAINARLDADQLRFIRRYRGIEPAHLARIGPKQRDIPGLLITWKDDTDILADGGHRYVRRWMDGYRDMDFIRLTEKQARTAVLAVGGPLLEWVAEKRALYEAVMGPLYRARGV